MLTTTLLSQFNLPAFEFKSEQQFNEFANMVIEKYPNLSAEKFDQLAWELLG